MWQLWWWSGGWQGSRLCRTHLLKQLRKAGLRLLPLEASHEAAQALLRVGHELVVAQIQLSEADEGGVPAIPPRQT